MREGYGMITLGLLLLLKLFVTIRDEYTELKFLPSGGFWC